MRPALFLFPLLLAACDDSPRDTCISSASSELRIMNGLVAETRANLARGYAVNETTTTREINSICTRPGLRGRTETFSCPETVTETQSDPIAIDLNAEQAKLASLEQRQAQMQSNANAQIAQCRARNPT